MTQVLSYFGYVSRDIFYLSFHFFLFFILSGVRFILHRVLHKLLQPKHFDSKNH